jgi:hypothetical protein
LPKFKLVGENEMASVSPTPVSTMVCVGLAKQLSTSVTAPLRAPVAVGVNASVIAQFCPGVRVGGQVLVSAPGGNAGEGCSAIARVCYRHRLGRTGHAQLLEAEIQAVAGNR